VPEGGAGFSLPALAGTPASPLIEFRNVTVMRGARVALNGITLSIDPGEHVAILGPNGSGKSTLIKTITRECYPLYREGSWVKILGRETWHVFDLRAMLGLVASDLMKTHSIDVTGREAVLSGYFSSAGIWPNHVVTQEMERRADEILKLLEIRHLAGRDVEEMSSGELRRVLIGRALVHNPKALVLDEPTTSLDIHSQHEVREALRKLAAGGVSTIVVTHHLPDIIPEVKRVILIRDGKVFRDGPKEELLNTATLREVFRTEVEFAVKDGFFHMW
jgi:iron complex transport system ATP-binding protein